MKALVFLFSSVCLVTVSRSWAQTVMPYDTLHITCVRFPAHENVMVIDNQEEFERMDYLRRGSDCEPLPEIDFERKMVLAYSVRTTGCRPPTSRATITLDDSELLVLLQLTPYGICRVLYYSVFWFVIDKPRYPVNVDFRVVP